MKILIFGIIFLSGLVIGSFLNVIILRGARGDSFGGRSRCESCKKTLAPRELIPILSFCIQKGRCRSCGAVLSLQYPIVELATGILFAASAWYIFTFLHFEIISLLAIGYWLLAAVALAAIIVIITSDIRFQIIPNGAVLALFLIGIAAAVYRSYIPNGSEELSAKFSIFNSQFSINFQFSNFVYDVTTAAILTFILFALWLFSRGRWMGFGDVKLIGATSLLLGFPAAVAAFLFSFWLGGIAGIILLLTEKKTLQSRMPFGPFILAGSVLAYFFSQPFFGILGL